MQIVSPESQPKQIRLSIFPGNTSTKAATLEQKRKLPKLT